MQPALRDYLTKLREEAYIDIKPGYTDSGASPNQTKLIYTSDSGPKTKQVRGKLGVGKKKTVVVVGKEKNDQPKPAGSTSELGLAKPRWMPRRRPRTIARPLTPLLPPRPPPMPLKKKS